MLTSEIPFIATIYSNPLKIREEGLRRQAIEWGLLTGCLYIIIVSTENKQLSAIFGAGAADLKKSLIASPRVTGISRKIFFVLSSIAFAHECARSLERKVLDLRQT